MDETNDSARLSWIASANGHPEFPIQNLPFGAFAPPGGSGRIGVAIGDDILDLPAVGNLGLLEGLVDADVLGRPTLNALMALGSDTRAALRRRLFALLDAAAPDRDKMEGMVRRALWPARDCLLHLPAVIGDYTDFYAGIHHATNAARFRNPDAADPLQPNYRHMPIGYHGRASSVCASGLTIARPFGQYPADAGAPPQFAPTARLDYELELAIWVGPGNDLGTAVPIGEAAAHIWGFGLLNDLSARDVQRWEMAPLGPFLSKSFASVVSPWIVTPEALAPFRVPQAPRSDADPWPLDYLWESDDQAAGALDIELEAVIRTARMMRDGAPAHCLSRAAATDLYWTPAQMVAHHTSNGCNLRPGDLLGSGTISGRDPGSQGCLLELTANGTQRIRLPNGESRLYLEDGDEISLRGHCRRDGFATIGFGACTGRIAPARAR